MNHNPRDLEWQRRYEQEDTPWDKGAPAPALTAFLHEKQMSGRVLVPGCGRGHDVRALGTQPNTSVVGLDLSATAIAQAKELSSTLDMDASFIVGDFFNLPSKLKRSFDWLVEHTCFCAIEPRLRPDYILAASSALRTGGRIFGIFYLNPDTESGPPFAVSKKELTELFDPHFTLLEEWAPMDSFPGREGRELVRVMQKR
jgi:SAM-dependent methyltransferase